MSKKVTAGRDYLGDVAPQFAGLNDDVLFAPGVRNNWHIHQVEQTLFVIRGRGWYVEEGQEPRELFPGDVVNIPGGKRHWHGAAKDSWFEHVAMEDVTGGEPEWCEPAEFEE